MLLFESECATQKSNYEQLSETNFHTRCTLVGQASNDPLFSLQHVKKNDEKYTRLHKRLIERKLLTDDQSKLCEALLDLKMEIDTKIIQNANILNNESFVEQMMSKIIIDKFRNKYNFEINSENTKIINKLVTDEYINEFNGMAA